MSSIISGYAKHTENSCQVPRCRETRGLVCLPEEAPRPPQDECGQRTDRCKGLEVGTRLGDRTAEQQEGTSR